MLAVLGEALVDLVIEPDGAIEAKLGGAPYNTARAAARLGAPTRFGGSISHDRFGSMLAAQLVDDGVDVSTAYRCDAPTTLAAAEIDHDGSARYHFYFDGTSAPLLTEESVASTIDGASIVFSGGLGLVLEPMASLVVDGCRGLGDDVVLAVDVNCRPAVIDDRDLYLARIHELLGRVDLLKVSDEDLDVLVPGADPLVAAESIARHGPRAVVVTAGGRGATVVTDAGRADVPVPPLGAPIVDTIGAGDTFIGGLLAWWSGSACTREQLVGHELVDAVAAGHAAAAVVVTRRGADPPRRDEVPSDWGPGGGHTR